MGRDPLGRDERKVSGRNWSESPLKLEADLKKLDAFLSSKNKTKKSNQFPKIITEKTKSESENKNLKQELKSIISEESDKNTNL